MRRPLTLVVVCAALIAGLTSAADDDPVTTKLSAAKAEYESATGKARTGLLADLKKREDAAQKVGDLKTLEKVQAETKAFLDEGVLPKSVPTKGYTGEIRRAKLKMSAAFAAAVKQYTKDGNLKAAKQVQEQADVFDADGLKWTALFNGKDLNGWQSVSVRKRPMKWDVVDGVLHGKGPPGYLVTEKADYSEFRFRVEARLADGANSGLVFLYRDQNNFFEAEITGQTTGQILQNQNNNFVLKNGGTNEAFRWNQWFVQEVEVRNGMATVRFDGRQVAAYEIPPRLRKGGAVGVQLWPGPQGVELVMIRKIELINLEN
jgi:hypothetical protein